MAVVTCPYILLLSLLHLLTLTCAAKNNIAVPVLCNGSLNVSEDLCDFCITFAFSSPTPVESDIEVAYILDQVIFYENSTGQFTWTYNQTVVDNPNITVTLFTWNARTAQMGRPIPGCCDLPISRGVCHFDECVDGLVYIGVTYGGRRAVVPRTVFPSRPCQASRESARYFNICVHEETDWTRRYNCECVRYDSVTGEMLPGNQTTEAWGMGGMDGMGQGVWFGGEMLEEEQRYQVCQFHMDKEQVEKRGKLINETAAMEPVLFRRGVYEMRGLELANGSVMDGRMGDAFNCTYMEFEGTEVFNISSSSGNNDTFTCLILWPNGTEKFEPMGTHVKCMPQNVTFGKSHVYVMKEDVNPVVSAMIYIVPICGTFILLVAVCFLAIRWRRKLSRFMKETKSVPDELDNVLKDILSHDEWEYIVDRYKYDKETPQAYDQAEKERISSVKKSRESERKQSKQEIPLSCKHEFAASPVRASDKRIQRDDEFSDSEDEGEGGRKNQESHQKKKRKLEEGEAEAKPAPAPTSKEENKATKTEISAPEEPIKSDIKAQSPPSSEADGKDVACSQESRVGSENEKGSCQKDAGKAETAKPDPSSSAVESASVAKETDKDASAEEKMEH